MFKTLGLSVIGIFSAAAAYAAPVAYVTPVPPEMIGEQASSMGGSGFWLIPLLFIALVFIAGSSTTTVPQNSG
ncbi:MAG: hypothetical protein COA53_10160 [Rhodobacteraceae bacterium]|nr:MAG: hypothetical protein COA53_10160 [Paracoccaceae bacterium]